MHKFRHTYACNLLWSRVDANGVVQRGVDIKTVSRWMGHSTTTITQKYLEAMPDLEGLDMINMSRMNQWFKSEGVRAS
jgi:integrase